MFPPPIEAGPEVERISSLVGKHFTITGVRYTPPEAVIINVNVGDAELEGKFDALRMEMIPLGYIPIITRDQGQYVIVVTKKRDLRFSSVYVNLTLLILTILTTVISGSTLYMSYASPDRKMDPGEMIASAFRPENLGMGALTFAFPLMLILGIHESAHYLTAKKHKVSASLPFFIPMPPFISPLGTLGAFISIREPIPNKKALMDIGAAGPIAGFVVAIPVTLVGMHLTVTEAHIMPSNAPGSVELGISILYYLLASLFPSPEHLVIHPTAFAGWVGLLVTALNLLPAGQLDGGHIVRALFGPSTKWLSIAMVMFMFIAGFLFFPSWIIFAFLIMIFGITHPPPLNDITPIDLKRKAIGVFCVLLLVLTFVPEPMKEVTPVYSGRIELLPGETAEKDAPLNSTVMFNFSVTNTGNADMEINVTVNSIVDLEYRGLKLMNSTMNCTSYYNTSLAAGESRNLTLTFFIPPRTDLISKTYFSKIILERVLPDKSRNELDSLPFMIHVVRG